MNIKICCISSIKEAELAIEFGAGAIGLVSEMPSGPGVIEDDLISKIAEHVRGKIETFLLTSKQSAEEIIKQHHNCKTTTLQLVDSIDESTYEDLKSELNSVKLIQVIHVADESSIEEAEYASEFVDGLLLDSGNPLLNVKELGGTGKTHNWEISKRIVDEIDKPVYLAGGLNPKNVADSIMTVKPFGVDICSGVRSNGKLDERKLSEFINNARSSSQ